MCTKTPFGIHENVEPRFDIVAGNYDERACYYCGTRCK